ncbi:MAG TPA: class I SAM-dependent methyltransferase [Gemmatimonadales bacterium]|nr:class I SAM-dependent methyltransferase [Gemmatimonadales bacterium]
MTRAASPALAAALLGCGGHAPDVIYLASTGDVVTHMLEVARVDSADVVYDLGCGDGRIVIAAARDRGARGVCVDIDASLVAKSRHNADTAGVADRIEFRHADMFETHLGSATVVALYLSPTLNVRLRPKLFREVRPGAWIVSHNFDMGDWKPDTVVRVTWPSGTTSAVQAWRLPADVAGTWEVLVSGDAVERRFRVRFVQQYQQLSGTASEEGRTMTVAGARLAGDSIAFELSPPTGDHPDLLRLSGRVTGSEMRGTVWSPRNTAGVSWRAARP